MAKDAMRVANTQELTVTRRLKGERKRAQKKRTKDQYDTAPMADVSASAKKMVSIPWSPRRSINSTAAKGAAILKAAVASTNPKRDRLDDFDRKAKTTAIACSAPLKPKRKNKRS